MEELRQEKLEIDQQLRTIHSNYGPDRGEYREDYRGFGRDHRGSYDNENYHRQSHDLRDSYHSAGGSTRRDQFDGSYQRNTGSGHISAYKDHQGKMFCICPSSRIKRILFDPPNISILTTLIIF